jgi:integrase
MTQQQIDTLVSQYLTARLHEAEETVALLEDPVAREVRQFEITDTLYEITAALAAGDVGAYLDTASTLLRSGDPVRVRVLARRLAEAHHEALLAELRGLGGEPMRPLPRPMYEANGTPVAGSASTLAADVASGKLLSEVVGEYAEQKRIAGRWTVKTERLNRYILDAVTELLGDKPILGIGKEDGRELFRLIPRVPSHAAKRYPHATVREAIALADSAGNTERLSPKSVNIWFTNVKSLFKWAVENDYIDKSPMIVLKEVDEADADQQRPAFDDGELDAFFTLLTEDTSPAMQWVPRLMLYAGLRLEEAAGLRGCDIREESGLLVIDVRKHAERRVKTTAAKRIVPVHDALASALATYARSVKPEENLWRLAKDSSDTFSGALSKRLNNRIRRAVPGNEKLVAYSLRHTFSTRLKQADVQEHVISELMGHKVDSLAVGRYGKKLKAPFLKVAIDKLVLPNSTVP